MKDLKNKHCKPCEGGVCPLDENLSTQHLNLIPGWELADNNSSITRTFKFPDFLTTMSFINAVADDEWVAVEISVDSGATETVMSEEILNGIIDIMESAACKRGIVYEVADGALIREGSNRTSLCG